MIGYYNVSVILTYLSLFFAMMGIFSARESGGAFAAVLFLMLSGVCDMFDGTVAKRCRRNAEEKNFGIQIDSLCDLIAFGVLPAMIVLNLTEGYWLARISAVLLVLTSVIRLGYFNVQETLREPDTRRTVYEGLPVTLVSLLLPLALLAHLVLPLSLNIYLPLCTMLIAAAEISRLPVKKPHGKMIPVVVIFGLLLAAAWILWGKNIGAI